MNTEYCIGRSPRVQNVWEDNLYTIFDLVQYTHTQIGRVYIQNVRLNNLWTRFRSYTVLAGRPVYRMSGETMYIQYSILLVFNYISIVRQDNTIE